VPTFWTTFARVFLLALAASSAACSPVYVVKSWAGHRRLVSARRPIEAVLADPASPPQVKAGLTLVQDIRSFAVGTMTFTPSSSYTTYAEAPRPYVTLAVSACRRTAFEPHQWWFPVVGKVPYKGFFNEDDARGEAARLERAGFDVDVSSVQAYSTLGWFSDPVVSTMLREPPGRLARTLLHEMTHAEVYFKGRTDFDESAAAFIARQGAEGFVRSRFGPDSPELRALLSADAKERALADEVGRLYDELDALYSSPATEDEKLSRRREIFERFRSRLWPGWASAPRLNNAVVLMFRRYHLDLDDFQRAFAGLGGDWRAFMGLLRSLDAKRPREALRERLDSLPTSTSRP